jgi:hypothetical protein
LYDIYKGDLGKPKKKRILPLDQIRKHQQQHGHTMGFVTQLTAIATLALMAAPAAAAPACSNTLFQVDGYRATNTGANFKNAPVARGWTNVLFKYEGGIIPVVDKLSLDETLARAVPALEKLVVDQHRRCPGHKVALHGYSFGALVAGKVIESLAQKQDVPHNKINAVLFGDPRRPSQNKGTEGPAGGCLTVLPNLPGTSAPGPRDTGSIDVSYVCNQNDVICNMANPFTNAMAVANEVAGYLAGVNGDHNYHVMNPFGKFSHPGDHYNPQPPRLQYGRPLPIPLPTPNKLLNNNPLYKSLLAAGSDLVGILRRFGLEDTILKPITQFLGDNGIKF